MADHGAYAAPPSGPDDVAATPSPPYTAVIFTSVRTGPDPAYDLTAAELDRLVRAEPGYLGHESAREGIGITVSYWADEASARVWKARAAHLVAQRRGQQEWYRDYRVRVATVTREYGHPRPGAPDGDHRDPGPPAG